MDKNHVPCWIVIGGIAVYLLLFLFATKPVSLRCGRLGWILLAWYGRALL